MTTTETVLVEVSAPYRGFARAGVRRLARPRHGPPLAVRHRGRRDGAVRDRRAHRRRASKSTNERGSELAEHFGTYVEIDRPRRLVFDFGTSFEETPTRITVTIVADGDGSLLTLLHEGVWPRSGRKLPGRAGRWCSIAWRRWWSRRRPLRSRAAIHSSSGGPGLRTLALLDRELEGPAHASRREVQRASAAERARDDLFDDDMAETAPLGRHDGRSVALSARSFEPYRSTRPPATGSKCDPACRIGRHASDASRRQLVHGQTQILNGLGPQGEWRACHVDTSPIDLCEWLQLRRDQIAERCTEPPVPHQQIVRMGQKPQGARATGRDTGYVFGVLRRLVGDGHDDRQQVLPRCDSSSAMNWISPRRFCSLMSMGVPIHRYALPRDRAGDDARQERRRLSSLRDSSGSISKGRRLQVFVPLLRASCRREGGEPVLPGNSFGGHIREVGQFWLLNQKIEPSILLPCRPARASSQTGAQELLLARLERPLSARLRSVISKAATLMPMIIDIRFINAVPVGNCPERCSVTSARWQAATCRSVPVRRSPASFGQ